MRSDPSLVSDLRRAIQSGNALVVVGAGVSLACTGGVPEGCWTGLLKNGVQRARAIHRLTPEAADSCLEALSGANLASLLEVADKITDAFGGPSGGEFASWLRNAFERLTPTEPGLLEELTALQLPVATTNYDGLIEGVTGWEPVTWMQPAEFQRVDRGDARAVLHFHGWWKHPQSVVLGSASYDAVVKDFAASNALRALAWTRSWIFVGFGAGLEDPNFTALRDWLRRATSGSEYRHYRLVLDTDIGDAAALHDVAERIVPVGYGASHGDLLTFIRSLVPSVPQVVVHDVDRWADGERTAASARRLGRFLAAGLDSAVASELVADPVVASAVDAVEPMSPGTVQLVVGDLGSGKSTVADGLHYRNVEQYQQGAESRVPVYLHARAITVDPLDAQIRAIAFDTPAANGALLVLDGADELPDRDLVTLLAETRALVKSWAGSAAILFSRSPPEQPQPGVNTVVLPHLGDSEAAALVSRVAGRDAGIGSWPDGLRDAVRRPLFALLAGELLRSGETPASIPSLIDRLIELSLREPRRDHPEALDLISRLATVWLDTGRGVPLASQARSFAERSAVSRARLVAVNQAGLVTFPIPLIAEWLGARRLLAEPHLVETVTADPSRLERWRYALAIALVAGPHAEVAVLMRGLAVQSPGFASWALSEVESGAWAWEDEPLPPAHEAGQRILSSLAAWKEGLSSLAGLVVPLRPDGRLMTLAVDIDGQSLSTVWCAGDDLPPLVSDGRPISRDRYHRSRARTGVYGTPTWEWSWTWSELRDGIGKLIRDQALPPPTSPLQAEADYRLAVAITRSPTALFALRPISTEEIAERVSQVPPGLLIKGGQPWRSEDGHALVRALRERQVTSLIPPWPGPDLPGGGWIWDGWSPDALVTRGEAVTRAALAAYRAVVDRWFPRFADELGRTLMWPFELIVTVTPGRGSGIASAPSLLWHLEPLPTGQVSTSTWTVNNEAELWSWWVMGPGSKELYERWVGVRPELGRRTHLTISGGHYGLFRIDPASRLLYSWLWEELARVKSVSGPAPTID